MRTFVGRSDELEKLAKVALMRVPGPSAGLVVGDPGSGKSRLLGEARSRAALRHSFAVVGYESEQHVPLAAASGLLRALREQPRHGRAVDELMLGPQGSSGLEPVRVFEAAHRAFQHVEPALLVVDDLQWVDDLSLALCHYLIRAARDTGQRVVVFAATRPGGSGTSLLDALSPESVTMLELQPLSREEGMAFALDLDGSLDDRSAAAIWEAARGSPFWLEALVQTGGDVSGLGRFLTARLRHAGSDPATLLGILAVAARPISLTHAAAIAEWPAGRIEAAVRDLLDRGLAVMVGGAVRLSHDLIREGAIAEMPESWQREIHARLARRLQDEAGTDVQLLGEALQHSRAAGAPTFDLATRLLQSPHRRLLGGAGLALLSEIADEAEPFEPGTLPLQEAVASLATELAEHEQAVARWSLVADRTDDPNRRAEALLAASKAAFELGRAADARALLDASRRAGASDPLVELEQRTHESAILLWLEQKTAEGRAIAHDAVAAATALTTRTAVPERRDAARRAFLAALRISYEAAMQEEDYPSLLRFAEQREAEARGFDLDVYLTASIALSLALRHNGRLSEGVPRLQRAWEEAHRHVLPRVAVEAGYWLAQSLALMGALVTAEEVAGEASRLASRAGDVPRTRYRVARAEANVAIERGHPGAALARLERQAADEPNEHQRIAFHEDLALWHARLRGPAAAGTVQKHVDAGEACVAATGCPKCGAQFVLLSAEALARIGNRTVAARMLARWDRRGVVQGDPLDAILRVQAGALAERGARRRAEGLAAALERAEGSPYILPSLWIRFDLGRTLAEAGNEEGVGQLERVAASAFDLGAGTLQELSERSLRSLGVRTWKRGEAGAPLTRREQEIARLVAEGATNREISEALFLAPKTVERHVSNALRKVGARNRTELTSRLRDPGPKHTGNPR